MTGCTNLGKIFLVLQDLLYLLCTIALSFYVTKTVLVGPKWFWSHRRTRHKALPVMEFQDQGYKIRKIFAYKSTYTKEIIEF